MVASHLLTLDVGATLRRPLYDGSGCDISFVVLERTDAEQRFILKNDTLRSPGSSYDFMGKSLHSSGKDLKRIRAYQEYWHSRREFHPLTQPLAEPFATVYRKNEPGTALSMENS
jgi:hypothetical protein